MQSISEGISSFDLEGRVASSQRPSNAINAMAAEEIYGRHQKLVEDCKT